MDTKRHGSRFLAMIDLDLIILLAIVAPTVVLPVLFNALLAVEALVFWLLRKVFMARDTARQARADQRASRRRQQEWFEAVARQRARGHAGFADEAEARSALAGRGGRPSNLDRRRF
jgi:hypothetical protein